MKSRYLALVALVLVLWAFAATAEFRFPMPEFESGYKYPDMSVPPPAKIPVLVDISVLSLTLAATAFAVLRLRSRKAVFCIALFSLIYFGFYRKGCICPVGSIQNVLDFIFGNVAAVPLVVAVFFILPLVFALYFGRVFCAAVCPLGAAQEMCAVYPVQVPSAVESVLGLLPYAYLGLATLSVGMGAGYIICQYDPFVGFFRQGATFGMLLTGGILLLIGVFVARPYCRYLCPYGVLLRWASRFSKWHASITPAECTQCRLCEDSCPYGAISIPVPEDAPISRREGAKKLGWLLAAAPLIIAAGAVAGVMVHEGISRMHPVVRLAERVAAEEKGVFLEHSLESDGFRAGQQSIAELYDEANALRRRFRFAAAGFGAFMGLVVCGRLIRLSVVRKSKDYEADRAACLSCARCFVYCPVERTNADT